jgi:hypothetical protein
MRHCIKPGCTGTLRAYGCATTDADGDVTQRVRCATCGFATHEVEANRGGEWVVYNPSANDLLFVYTLRQVEERMRRAIMGDEPLSGTVRTVTAASAIAMAGSYLAQAPRLDLARGAQLDDWADRMGMPRQVTQGLFEIWTETDGEVLERLTKVGEAAAAFFAGLAGLVRGNDKPGRDVPIGTFVRYLSNGLALVGVDWDAYAFRANAGLVPGALLTLCDDGETVRAVKP